MTWMKNNLYIRVIINLLIQITGFNLFANLFITGRFRYLLKFVVQYFVFRALLTLNFVIFGWFIMIHSYILSIFVFPFIIYYSIKLILKLNDQFDKNKTVRLEKDE